MKIINSLDSIKNKEATIIPINKKDSKCFQYAVTIVLNNEETRKYFQRKIKIKPFINKYNWKGINFSSEKNDWKKIEKTNVTIALNVLYVKKKKKNHIQLISQNINLNHKKQVILLMTSNREG